MVADTRAKKNLLKKSITNDDVARAGDLLDTIIVALLIHTPREKL